MARRSLPERTVDAWVAASLCGRFPDARIWGPTQNASTNWDAGVGIAGKAFILEDKATTPGTRKRKAPRAFHRTDIDLDQLDWYCDTVEPSQIVPVYYVLPHPPWLGEPTGWDVLPDQVSERATFDDWAWVMRCHQLRSWLGASSAFETHRLPSSPAIKFSQFLDGVAACTHGRRIFKDHSGPKLKAEAARLEIDLQVDRAPLRSDLRTRHLVGSSLAVFVPAAALPAHAWFD